MTRPTGTRSSHHDLEEAGVAVLDLVEHANLVAPRDLCNSLLHKLTAVPFLSEQPDDHASDLVGSSGMRDPAGVEVTGTSHEVAGGSTWPEFRGLQGAPASA